MKIKKILPLALFSVVVVPFVTTNCSITSSNNSSSTDNQMWEEGTNTSNMSESQQNERTDRFNNFLSLYNEYTSWNMTSNSEQVNSTLSSLDEKLKSNSTETKNLITSINETQNQNQLKQYKSKITLLYKDNDLEYCFISYQDFLDNYIDEIQGTNEIVISDFQKGQLYYAFLVKTVEILSNFGNQILDAYLYDLTKTSSDNTNNESDSNKGLYITMSDVKIQYDYYINIFQGNSETELGQYGPYITSNNNNEQN